MPFLRAGGQRLHYRVDGPARVDGSDAPVLVLSHSLGADLSMWDAQVPILSQRHRLVRYDARGHGASPTSPAPFGVERLGQDVVELLDGLGIARASFCGLSLGGLVGQWLGLRAPGRLDRLVLCNTGARIGTDELWTGRIEAVLREGTEGIADAVLSRWFTPAFAAAARSQVEDLRRVLVATPAAGYAACCAAIRDADFRVETSRIRAPTLVIAGSEDRATPPAEGRFLAERIPGARYLELPAAHLSCVEAAGPFTEAVRDFLAA